MLRLLSSCLESSMIPHFVSPTASTRPCHAQVPNNGSCRRMHRCGTSSVRSLESLLHEVISQHRSRRMLQPPASKRRQRCRSPCAPLAWAWFSRKLSDGSVNRRLSVFPDPSSVLCPLSSDLCPLSLGECLISPNMPGSHRRTEAAVSRHLVRSSPGFHMNAHLDCNSAAS